MKKYRTVTCEICRKEVKPAMAEKIKPASGRAFYICPACVKKAMKGK